MVRVFFVLFATGAAIGQSQVDEIRCHDFLNWTIVKPNAHLSSPPYNSQTVALNAVDGIVPNTAQGEILKCAITKGGLVNKSLTIDLHRTYLISSVKTYLREIGTRAIWQTGLEVYVGPNNNTHVGNTQCGSKFTFQRRNSNYEPVFNCSSSVRGRFVFLLKSYDTAPSYIRRQGLQVCEVAVKGVVTCDQSPPPIQNTIVQYSCSSWNALEATYDCTEGYISQTPRKFRCGLKGTWEAVKKQEPCSPVDCGNPDDPGNGYHMKLSNNYKFTAEIEYACHYGYKLQGERKASCQSTGNWGPQSPRTCQVMRCPGLDQLKFRSVEVNGNHVNGTAKFKCNSGYNLAGPQTITCKVINGVASWSRKHPKCRPKTCSAPDVPVNGKIVGDRFLYPRPIQFVCNEGYVLTPAAKSVWRCSENGKWKDNEKRETKFPTCEPVNCNEPLMIGNGKYIGNEFTFGKKITYECNPGFKRSAWVQSTCLHTGDWSLTPPQCSQIHCLYLSSPDNGKMDSSAQITPVSDGFVFNFDSVLTFSCHPGYDVTINNEKANVKTVQLKCEQEGEQEEARGVWKGRMTSQPPTCQPKDCGSLPDIPDGKVAFIPNTFYPGKARYSCNAGFQIAEEEEEEDAAIRSCGTNGIWEGAEPHCEPVSCGAPPSISNGLYKGELFTFGHSVTYQCNVGYERRGYPELECIHTGQWSSPPPNCSAVNCGQPPTVRNGHFRGKKFVFGDKVEYYCDRGFRRVRSSTLECIYTSKWYPAPPKCLELLCPYWRAPKNGESWFSGLIVGSIVHYSCNPGYTIAINNERVDDIERVSFRCIQIGNQDTARSMWKGALTSMPPTCKPSNN